MVGQFELAFRVGTAVFVIVTPTVLFLGLWRGLELMRDDEIIARARQEGYVSSSPSTRGFGGAMLPDAADETAATDTGTTTATVTCDACGASNIPEAAYCHECLEELPDD